LYVNGECVCQDSRLRARDIIEALRGIGITCQEIWLGDDAMEELDLFPQDIADLPS
jgi:hypothetical protein